MKVVLERTNYKAAKEGVRVEVEEENHENVVTDEKVEVVLLNQIVGNAMLVKHYDIVKALLNYAVNDSNRNSGEVVIVKSNDDSMVKRDTNIAKIVGMVVLMLRL